MKEENKLSEQPTSLEHCFEILDKTLQNKDLFRDTLESNAIAMAHHGLGGRLRNSWYLWWSPETAKKYAEAGYPQEIPVIVKYFNDELNIFHADDMSAIITTSYHRFLNKKELKINEQVKKYHAHWAKEARM